VPVGVGVAEGFRDAVGVGVADGLGLLAAVTRTAADAVGSLRRLVALAVAVSCADVTDDALAGTDTVA
jgi:hypothetical protein